MPGPRRGLELGFNLNLFILLTQIFENFLKKLKIKFPKFHKPQPNQTQTSQTFLKTFIISPSLPKIGPNLLLSLLLLIHISPNFSQFVKISRKIYWSRS